MRKQIQHGSYILADLPIGNYEVSGTAAGFARVKEKINIAIGAHVRLDLQLRVGDSSQTVEVSASTTEVVEG